MAPTKDEIAIFTAKLSANARVNLYDKNYLSLIKWTFPLLLLFLMISLSSFFFVGALSQSQLIISSLFGFALLVCVQLIAKRARVASIKGDTLILKGIDAKSTVTSIRSVKKAQSYQIFGVQITQLYYTLDQQKRSSLVFGAPSGMSTSLDQLFYHAKKYKKK